MALPSLFVVGDSIGDPSFLSHDGYAELITSINVLRNYSAQNEGLVNEIEPTYAADIATKQNFSIAIIQGGVNDSVDSTLADTKTALTSCVASAAALGKDIFVLSIAPWRNAGTWSAGRQTFTDDYNTWLIAQATVQGFTYVDVYTALEDPANADELLPAYDSGDGLHPTLAGSQAMADVLQPLLNPLLVDDGRTDVANTIKQWRGAVEPAELSASGNEIKLWRGAVEPLGAVTSASTYIAITRRTAKQMAQNKRRMQKPGPGLFR